MRGFLILGVFGLVAVASVGVASAGKLDDRLATEGPAAIAAMKARSGNARDVRRAIRTVAARPDVRAVLSGGGQVILGVTSQPKTHMRAEVYQTVSAALVLRAPEAGRTAPRLSLRQITVQEGQDGPGFVRHPFKTMAAEDQGNLAYAKGSTRTEKAHFAAAVARFDLTPARIADATLFTP